MHINKGDRKAPTEAIIRGSGIAHSRKQTEVARPKRLLVLLVGVDASVGQPGFRDSREGLVVRVDSQ